MLNSLRDFPDREAILKITKFAEEQINSSVHVADILLAKIIDPSTNITFKVPLFYCMDSIMKNVGGPYAFHFSRYLADIFSRAYDEVPLKDKEKLNKMLIFWEERNILPQDVMQKMRHHVASGVAVRSYNPPVVQQQHSSVPVNSSVRVQPTKSTLPIVSSDNFNTRFNHMQTHTQITNNNISLPLNVNLINQPPPIMNNHVSFIESKSIQNDSLMLEKRQSNFINAFICERPVIVDLNKARNICYEIQTVPSHLRLNSLANNEITMLATKLTHLIDSNSIRPNLPGILFGPLPLKPSALYKDTKSNTSKNTVIKKARPMIKMPPFRIDELNKKPVKAVNMLYTERCHQYSDDGMRFKTLQELANHTDTYLTKKEAMRKKELSGEKSYRFWFEKASQWNKEIKENIVNKDTGSMNMQNITDASNSDATKETYVVPADEEFPKCVICKETFETIWDQDEGELYYNNAVKLLVTKKGNQDIFNQGAETLHESVHYCIVHMDGCGMGAFLDQGIVDSLSKAKSRYKNSNNCVVDMFKQAIGSDEEEDDIFCILELT